MKRKFSLSGALGKRNRGLDSNETSDQARFSGNDELVAYARDFATQASGSAASKIILELCTALEQSPAAMPEIRREIFREAVRGIANVIRKGQLPSDLPLASMLPGAYESPDALAREIERANVTQPVTLAELRQVRQKLKTESAAGDELDEMIKRIYYAKVFETSQSTDNILPPGSPSRSVDLASMIVQRILPNGWWTLGNNGANLEELSVAKVGTWAGDDPKPESAPTAPLALLSALVLTLIEAAKKEG